MNKINKIKIEYENLTEQDELPIIIDDEFIDVSATKNLKQNFQDIDNSIAEKKVLKDKFKKEITTALNINDNSLDVIDREIKNRINGVNHHIYGIRRKIDGNSSSKWERTDDSLGLIAKATKNGKKVFNDFDYLAPWSLIQTCNYNISENKVKAWIDEPTFKFDGSNGDVYTFMPEVYWKIYQEDDYEYIKVADYPAKGFFKTDSFYISRYTTRFKNNKVVSASGNYSTTNVSLTDYRNRVRATSDKMTIADWRFFIIQMLYLVEYADYNSQDMLGYGVCTAPNAKALIAENNVNRIIVADITGFYKGKNIGFGTANDVEIPEEQVRQIQNIVPYKNGAIEGYEITFNGTPTNITIETRILAAPNGTGDCDGLKMQSGTMINDKVYGVIYRGIENIFGNIAQRIDGINIKDNDIYYSKDTTQYDNTSSISFVKLNYKAMVGSGWISKLGFDVNHPFIRIPIAAAGTSNTYITDYCYGPNGNNVTCRVGGYFRNDAQPGLFYTALNAGPGYKDWTLGFRTIINP